MWLQHPVWPGEGDSRPFGARLLGTILEHDFGAAPGTGVFQAAPQCAALCHRLGSQVSSGTLWLGSIPLCCPQGALHGRAGGRPKARLEEALPALLPTLLPAASIPPQPFAPPGGHLEEPTGTIPVSCLVTSAGSSPWPWEGAESFRTALRCSISRFLYSPFCYTNELPH